MTPDCGCIMSKLLPTAPACCTSSAICKAHGREQMPETYMRKSQIEVVSFAPTELMSALGFDRQVRVPGFLAKEVRPLKRLRNTGHQQRQEAVQQLQATATVSTAAR